MINMKELVTRKNIILCSLFLLFLILLGLSILYKFPTANKIDYGTNNVVLHSIQSGDKIEETFISRVYSLETIGINVKNNRFLPNNLIYVSIYDSNDRLIYYNDIAKAELFDIISINFKFDPIPDSMFKKFKVVIEAKETSKKIDLQLLKTETSDLDEEKTMINNASIDSNLSLVQYGKQKSYFYTILFFVILVLIFIIFVKINFCQNEILKKFIFRKPWKLYVVEFFMSLVSFYFLLSLFLFTRHFTVRFGLFSITFFALIFILTIAIGNKKLKLEQLFLLIAIPISLAYLMFMLPLSQPDGFYHYNIAYRVSTGNIFSNVVLVPKGMDNSYKQYLDVFHDLKKLNYSNLTKYSSGIANPLLYILSSLGILIVRILGLSPVFGVYLGSMFNIFLYLFFGYYSIKKIPFKKMLLLVYLLTPMILQQAASLSYDAILNSFSILFICYIFYIHYDKKEIELKDYCILIISLLFILVCKYVYIFLGLLLLLVIPELKKFWKGHKKLILFSIFALLTLYLGWYLYTKVGLVKSVEGIKLKVPQTQQSKLMYILHNPINYIPIYFRTLDSMTDFYILGFLGNSLGKFNISIHTTYIMIYIIILVISALVDQTEKGVDFKTKFLNIIIFFIIFNLILFGIYLGWGISSDIVIAGVQGRYFIPIVLLILLSIPGLIKIVDSKDKLNRWILVIILITQALVVNDIVKCFL